MRYRSFLTKALSTRDGVTQMYYDLLALTGPAGETGYDPEVLSWCQQKIRTTVSSYPSDKRMSQTDHTYLLSMCGKYGSTLYAERYVTLCARTE